ncbi:E3 SUMO-protein ligase SIZ1 isoform X2 [Physcomitrium patens]|uniref:SP-RING-type domain-containing protein n=1 Tax=Physcomitrium patens TaxID=3218 RepID=A0A7I4CH09_PHYPA|nr:E3 SUMO-protein ligase SIZ1-like isoform X2 [Physcomitrium patens]XP_024361683.1 E3 SUMO-protein ligase SIZ1-like isoform X2 [Physcomitrium patens]|eukprot:XP_024361682.1 E3 SUMO-protein ligase SIZ1-like isoform X2 [Physcomitrella patens]
MFCERVIISEHRIALCFPIVKMLMDKIMGLINPAEKQPTKGLKYSKQIVSREEAIAIIEEEYRKLRHSRSESKRKAAKSGFGSKHPSAGLEELTCVEEAKTRCPCGNNTETGTMIQCVNLKCRVWQHMSCVVIPEKSGDGTQTGIPSNFYCELCRISRSDPFCEAQLQTLMPSKLIPSGANTEGSNIVQTLEKSFYLSRSDRELLQKPNHDLQVWCVLLSDNVSFRMHWPSFADLRVNGIGVRVTNRTGQQLLGANGRDEGTSVTVCAREGLNRLNISTYDARSFCLGVRIIRRLSLEQIMESIPNEKDGEKLEEAMARVRRCINGGGSQGLGADDDSDSDLEVVADFITVNLRCPMSGSRIKVAGRFKPCLHMGCFDLDTFVELNQQARKWQCPICLKNYCIDNLIIDPFFNRITNAVNCLHEDIAAVELKSDGFWRPKLEGRVRSREPWRPSPVVTNVVNETTSVPVLFSENVRTEEKLSSHDNGSSCFNRNPCGVLVLHCTENLNGGHSQEVINVSRLSRSNSITDGNLRGDEDEHSANQDRGAVSTVDGDNVGLSSRSPQPTSKTLQTCADLANGAQVIVLSDSEDEGEDEETIVVSSCASIYVESNVVGNWRMRSRKSYQTNGDSSGLAVGLEYADVTPASHSVCHPSDPATSRRIDIVINEQMTDDSGLGLHLDSGSLSAVPAEIARNGECGVHESQTEVVNVLQGQPVRQTPVRFVAGCGSSFRPLDKDDTTSPSGWESLCLPNGATDTDGGSMDNEGTGLPLQKFLPSQPVRVEVLVAEKNHALEEATHRTLLLQLTCTS